jgi:signal transduction histidine kinase
VQSGQEQLRKLAEQLVNVQEMERKSVSRTLHDETGQTLTALRMQLVAMEREVSADSTLLENIKEADNLLGETINRIRRLAYTLRPPELDTLGLSAALQRLCQDFRQYYKNIEIAYQGEEIPTLPESISISFYRCLQEALTNVAKHAEATNVKVEFSQNGKEIHLEVQDNGNGHAASSSQSLGGLGLLGMRERFERIDGKLTVVSDRESGTRLTATVPWEE